MIQLLLGMKFELGSDVRILGAAEHLGIDYIRDDGLIFAGEIFIQQLRQAITRNLRYAVRLVPNHFNSSFRGRAPPFSQREARRHPPLDASRPVTRSPCLHFAANLSSQA